ncbi:hypothetical protein V5O48_019701, partial [Marasmius crinis-equi]
MLVSYIRFYQALKVQDIPRDSLPYKAPFQPYHSYYSLVGMILMIGINIYSVFMDGHLDVGSIF